MKFKVVSEYVESTLRRAETVVDADSRANAEGAAREQDAGGYLGYYDVESASGIKTYTATPIETTETLKADKHRLRTAISHFLAPYSGFNAQELARSADRGFEVSGLTKEMVANILYARDVMRDIT